jgi:V/A-type H+/Na+-transporting ATPase subunit K
MFEERGIQKRFKRKVILSAVMVGLMAGFVLLGAFLTTASAADAEDATIREPQADVVRWAFLSAAISVGVSAVAAGIAVSYVGAAAMGAISEKPELVGRSLIFVGLAEGIAIYGLIIAIMILTRV